MIKIHVIPEVINTNRRLGTNDPPIKIIVDDQSTFYAREVELLSNDGKVAAKVVYDPDSKGAKVWVETENTMIIKR
jgi:hypothetical protein